MNLLLKLWNWLMGLLLTTDRVTEDTAGLQRKIIHRGTLGPFTDADATHDAGLVSYYTITDTLDDIDVTKNLCYVEWFTLVYNGSGSVQINKSSMSIVLGPLGVDSSYTLKTESVGGKMKLTFSIRTGTIFSTSQPLYLYYLVYSTRVTEDGVL